MRVKCKKFLSPLLDGKEISSSSFLTLEKEYIVLILDLDKRSQTVFLESDDGEVGHFDLRQFEIVSNYIPSNWIVQYMREFDSITLIPKRWVESENFWDLLEDDPETIAIFKKERDFIYEEEFAYSKK